MPSRTWIGGLREGGNASWPMCRLRFDEDGVTLEPSIAWLGRFVPTYSFPWARVAKVAAARGAILRSDGVRFQLGDAVPAQRRESFAKLWPESARNPVFWCTAKQRDEILAAVPDPSLVERTPQRVLR